MCDPGLILDQKKTQVVLLVRFGDIICRLVNNISTNTIFSYSGYIRCYHLKKLSVRYMEILYTVFFLWATFLFES